MVFHKQTISDHPQTSEDAFEDLNQRIRLLWLQILERVATLFRMDNQAIKREAERKMNYIKWEQAATAAMETYRGKLIAIEMERSHQQKLNEMFASFKREKEALASLILEQRLEGASLETLSKIYGMTIGQIIMILAGAKLNGAE